MERVNDYLLRLSGVISENQYFDIIENNELATAPEVKQLLQKLSVRLGNKRNVFDPVLNVIKNNKNLLDVFNRMLLKLATTNPAQAKSRVGNAFRDNSRTALRTGGKRINDRLLDDDADYKLLFNYFAAKRPELRELFEQLVNELMSAKTSTLASVVKSSNIAPDAEQ
jgi:hypothetical protein